MLDGITTPRGRFNYLYTIIDGSLRVGLKHLGSWLTRETSVFV